MLNIVINIFDHIYKNKKILFMIIYQRFGTEIIFIFLHRLFSKSIYQIFFNNSLTTTCNW